MEEDRFDKNKLETGIARFSNAMFICGGGSLLLKPRDRSNRKFKPFPVIDSLWMETSSYVPVGVRRMLSI